MISAASTDQVFSCPASQPRRHLQAPCSVHVTKAEVCAALLGADLLQGAGLLGSHLDMTRTLRTSSNTSHLSNVVSLAWINVTPVPIVSSMTLACLESPRIHVPLQMRVSSAEDMCIFDRKTVNLGRAVLPSTCKIAQLQPHTDESTRSEQMILRVCVCVCGWGGKSRF